MTGVFFERRGMAIRGSVTERADLERLLGACGRIDALVNNTGHPPGPIDPTGPGFQP